LDSGGDHEDEIKAEIKDGQEENEEVDLKETKHEDDATNPQLDAIWKLLAEHTIQCGTADSSGPVFQLDTLSWRDILHPKLSFLAPMLASLCEHVEPEYTLVNPTPPEFHLHEAMQRILLMNIWSMKDTDHISLDQKLRMVTFNHFEARVRTTGPRLFGSKRPLLDDENLGKSEFLLCCTLTVNSFLEPKKKKG
jgi:hypothetical protein